MIPTVLRCSRIGGAKLVHIRFGNAWFFSWSSSSFYRLPNGRVISPQGQHSMRVSESYRRITREKKNKEATNISNISPCDGVLIPIVVDPIKKRSTEGFFFFFFFLERSAGKRKWIWTGPRGKGELCEQTDGTMIHSAKCWIVTQKR